VPERSELDKKYFIDEHVYNCPFCNRRNVAYAVYNHVSFDWTENKRCYAYFVVCRSCDNQSMHLTFNENLDVPLVTSRLSCFRVPEGADAEEFLDQTFFFSVPTSFFVLDERVPKILRELLTEAEGCLKSNFLTGASACARKIIYELAVHKKVDGDNYEERTKALKKAHPEVEPEFFDTLLTIQQVTSEKVHENSYDGWEAKHLRIILLALSEVLHELYVAPARRKDRRRSIVALKDEVIGKLPPTKK